MALRRREPLHERLAREGGLRADPDAPHRTEPRWGAAGIHGIHRLREWDAVVTVAAEGADEQELVFVVLDGEVIVESDADVPEPLLGALDGTLEPPYRVVAVRQDERHWALGAKRIEVAPLDERFDAGVLEVAVHGGEEHVTVHGEPVLAGNDALFASVRALRRLAEERGLRDYVVAAERLDGPLWEVRVSAL